MEQWILVALIVVGVLILEILRSTKPKSNRNNKQPKKYPYKRKYILTKNEYYFYKKLKAICDKNNLRILVKTRLADIIDVDKNQIAGKEYMNYFGRIQSKHIDYLVCNGDSLYPLVAIELDDSSHNKENRIERDIFVNNAMQAAGIPLIRCKGAGNLEAIMQSYLPKQLNKQTEY